MRSAGRCLSWLGIAAALLLAACSGDAIPSAPASQPANQAAPLQQAQPQQPKQQQQEQQARPQPQQAAAAAQQTAGGEQRRPAGGRIAAPEPYDAEYTLAQLRALAGEIGARFNGRPGERAAVDFLAAELRRLGYAAAIEPFEFSFREPLHVINVAGRSSAAAEQLSLQLRRMEPSSGAAAAGPIAAVPGVGAPEDFAAVDVEGAIAVVARGELRFSAKQRNAEAAGAAALVVVNQREALFNGRLEAPGQIPVFAADSRSGELLRARAAAAAVIEAPSSSTNHSWNVVARRPGGVCRVVVGGHYDTVPNVVGANDNASGAATVLGLARAWAEADSAADLCLIGFGAEELGLHGSTAFIAAARDSGELDAITAMLNLDAFGDGNRPILAIGDAELAAVLGRLGAQLGIEVEAGQLPWLIGSDHLPFQNAGIPVIFPFLSGGILHTPADNLDNLDEALVRDVGLLAHAVLECLLERAGSAIEPRLACDAADP